MARPVKYQTEEERLAARRETWRKSKREGWKKYGKELNEKKKAERRSERIKAKQEKLKDVPGASWTPHFIGVDGESFITGETLPNGQPKQAYIMLYRHDLDYVLKPKKPHEWKNGLDTLSCLDYLSRKGTGGRKGSALVGFFLNFDFEWILKDLSQDEYKALQKGEKVQVGNGLYELQWIPSKFLAIHRMYFEDFLAGGINQKDEGKPPRRYEVRLQDTQGFFQSSFVSALKKWGFKGDERLKIIESGKAARGGFELTNWDEVAEYNAMELELLEELMMKIYESFRSAYAVAGLSFDKINAMSWSGPGAFANDFLRQTLWREEHPAVSEEAAEYFWKHSFATKPAETNTPYPFSMSYYGGRIELASLGRQGKTYNYDVRSAYPYALSLLPAWKAEDFRYSYQADAEEVFSARRMGMYRVDFRFPVGSNWYPFPVRAIVNGSPNVFYPHDGVTWIMSPELFAAYDTLTDEEKKCIRILEAYELLGSEGFGDGLTRMNEEKLCTTARYTMKLAKYRSDCKDAKKRLGTEEERPEDANMAQAENALKLILNSEYGKTIQQVGGHKYFSDFGSAWITSVCRALIWRGVAPERKTDNVIMTMTDGLYAKVKLPFCEGLLADRLGAWEGEEFDEMETFKPGIYRYYDEEGCHYKVRGFLTPGDEDKESLFHEIDKSMRQKGYIGSFPARDFQSRNISLDGWSREPYRYQFLETSKEIKSNLSAKREKDWQTGWSIAEGMERHTFPPKIVWGTDSVGYELKFVVSDEDIAPGADDDVIIDEWLSKKDALSDREEWTE